MKKQFTKKEIEKRFQALYSEGEIYLSKKQLYSGSWYAINYDAKSIDIKSSNLYDIALELHLATNEEIAQMKKAAGYYSYK